MSSLSPRAVLERLIAFDTVSANSNRALIDFCAEYLEAAGAKVRLVPSKDGAKANLFATIGPETEGGVVLSGHTDVVPVEGQDWSSDPFTLTERGGKLYGRGTCDMKGFVALAVALAPDFAARDLKAPVHLALSYDEEVGCIGVRPLLAAIAEHLPRPRAVIVGEPSEMRVVTAHKGVEAFRTRITGKEAHSSQTDRAASAIMTAARLVAFLEDCAAAETENPDPAFDPPYTTVSVGTITGGTALNIVPRHCEFVWEYRTIPGRDDQAIKAKFDAYVAKTVLPALRANAPEAAIKTKALAAVPAFQASGGDAETLVKHLARTNETAAVSYATEAGLFEAYDMPTIICGPGSIDQAHQPDEFISVAQFQAGEAFLRRLMDALSE